MPVEKSVVPSLTITSCGVARITGRSAFALASVNVTSSGPLAFASVNCSASVLTFDAVAGFLWRISENTTSAGPTGLPS